MRRRHLFHTLWCLDKSRRENSRRHLCYKCGHVKKTDVITATHVERQDDISATDVETADDSNATDVDTADDSNVTCMDTVDDSCFTTYESYLTAVMIYTINIYVLLGRNSNYR